MQDAYYLTGTLAYSAVVLAVAWAFARDALEKMENRRARKRMEEHYKVKL